jgi:glucose-6-phosphate-specific signal transduction histidine kinase
VNNIIKCATTNRIAIDLKLYNKNIFLSIAVDGVGFDTRSKPRGIGLRNIQAV